MAVARKAICRRLISCLRSFENHYEFSNFFCRKLHNFPKPSDLEILNDQNLVKQIQSNIKKRQGPIDVEELRNLYLKYQSLASSINSKEERLKVENELIKGVSMLPNDTHPGVLALENDKIIHEIGVRPVFNFKPKELHNLTRNLDCLVNNVNVTTLMGRKSYYLTNCLAELEQALTSWAVERLTCDYGFNLISVPDMLNRDIVEACGFNTRSKRNQVFKVKNTSGEADVCLSGTAEIALAAMYKDEVLAEGKLPQKLVSSSRCYRAEVSGKKEEQGIYRVCEFSKVEMFAITHGETTQHSNEMLEHFSQIQRTLYEDLGLHFRILDMCPSDLGNPAYRKYDIEAWMPGRQMFGEISSASNCTDYQSKRLGIKYQNCVGDLVHGHTVNGTVCAIPRMLIALVETFQRKDGSITVPPVLRKFVNKDCFVAPKKRFKYVRIRRN